MTRAVPAQEHRGPGGPYLNTCIPPLAVNVVPMLLIVRHRPTVWSAWDPWRGPRRRRRARVVGFGLALRCCPVSSSGAGADSFAGTSPTCSASASRRCAKRRPTPDEHSCKARIAFASSSLGTLGGHCYFELGIRTPPRHAPALCPTDTQTAVEPHRQTGGRPRGEHPAGRLDRVWPETGSSDDRQAGASHIRVLGCPAV